MAREQKCQLEAWIQAPLTPQKIVLRSRICLLAHEGLGNRQIARQLNTSRPTVLLWRERFAQSGVAALEHEPPRKASSQRLDEELIKKS
jgi:transposase